MTYLIPEGADYGHVKWMLLNKIDRDRESGRPRDVFSEHDTRVLTEHDTSAMKVGEPCDACGKPWPCETVLSILAPE